MVEPMECLAHTQTARQFINRLKAMRVGAGRLVRYQNIGALGHQAKVVLRKYGTAVLARQAIAPAIPPAASNSQFELKEERAQAVAPLSGPRS